MRINNYTLWQQWFYCRSKQVNLLNSPNWLLFGVVKLDWLYLRVDALLRFFGVVATSGFSSASAEILETDAEMRKRRQAVGTVVKRSMITLVNRKPLEVCSDPKIAVDRYSNCQFCSYKTKCLTIMQCKGKFRRSCLQPFLIYSRRSLAHNMCSIHEGYAFISVCQIHLAIHCSIKTILHNHTKLTK